MKNIFTILAFLLSLNSQAAKLQTGTWRAVILLDTSGTELPFNFEVVEKGDLLYLEIINAEERIRVDEILIEQDSIIIRLAVFDSEFHAKIKGDQMEGYWWDKTRANQNKLPFKAEHDQAYRFRLATRSNLMVWKNYEVIFSKGTKEEYKAIGKFEQEGSALKGTFLTETGDYRYLQGVVDGDQMKLSCFDGAHAFLFIATISEEGHQLKGTFWSGAHWKEPWEAMKNDTASLRDPYALTFLKEGYDHFDFAFPNLDGDTVRLSDAKYQNKVVLVQIMGSWCPNCKDETAYLSDFHKQYRDKGLEVLALAFEKRTDFEKSAEIVKRLKTHYACEYDFLIAGGANKFSAAEKLPMLNAIISYPTTIFIDKKGRVRKIYTGFNGPATGDLYYQFKNETEAFVSKLLAE